MKNTLKDKRLVIIGGTSGIGLAAARAFVIAGARVVVVGNVRAEILPTQTELGNHAVVIQADPTQAECATKAIKTCLAHFGSFDGLYHATEFFGGKLGDGSLHELTKDAWFNMLDHNLTAVMYSNQAAIQQFLQQGSSGSILNLGSVLAQSPAPEHFGYHAYAAAKAGIVGMSKSAAAFYAPHNIRINVVAPSLIESPATKSLLKNEQIASYAQARQPLDGRRVGKPEDLDGLAVYFMSDLSKFTTGQVISVDGGWSVL